MFWEEGKRTKMNVFFDEFVQSSLIRCQSWSLPDEDRLPLRRLGCLLLLVLSSLLDWKKHPISICSCSRLGSDRVAGGSIKFQRPSWSWGGSETWGSVVHITSQGRFTNHGAQAPIFSFNQLSSKNKTKNKTGKKWKVGLSPPTVHRALPEKVLNLICCNMCTVHIKKQTLVILVYL